MAQLSPSSCQLSRSSSSSEGFNGEGKGRTDLCCDRMLFSLEILHPRILKKWYFFSVAGLPAGLLHGSGGSRDRHLQGEDTALKPSQLWQSRSLCPSRPAAAEGKITAKLVLQRICSSPHRTTFFGQVFPSLFDPFQSRKKAAPRCRAGNDNPIDTSCSFVVDFPRPRDPYAV